MDEKCLLNDPGRYEEYFSTPSSGKVVQKRLEYYASNELPTYDIREDISRHTNPDNRFLRNTSTLNVHLCIQRKFLILYRIQHFKFFENSNHSPHVEEQEKFSEMVKDFSCLV